MSFGIKASIRTGAIPVRAGVGTLGIGATRAAVDSGAPFAQAGGELARTEPPPGFHVPAFMLCPPTISWVRTWLEVCFGSLGSSTAYVRECTQRMETEYSVVSGGTTIDGPVMQCVPGATRSTGPEVCGPCTGPSGLA